MSTLGDRLRERAANVAFDTNGPESVKDALLEAAELADEYETEPSCAVEIRGSFYLRPGKCVRPEGHEGEHRNAWGEEWWEKATAIGAVQS